MAGPIRLLFVCSGNTCRSPLAAAVTRALAAAHGLPVVVDSAGLAARAGSPASPNAGIVAERHGLSLAGHWARQIAPADLAAFDLVLAMTEGQAAALRGMAPAEAWPRIRLLARFAPGHDVTEIADPWSGDLATYARTLALIEAACAGLVLALSGREGRVSGAGR
jgi:protein-tyrosine phosphatase